MKVMLAIPVRLTVQSVKQGCFVLFPQSGIHFHDRMSVFISPRLIIHLNVVYC